jgi:translocator protein
MPSRTLQIAVNIVALVATLVVNGLATTLPLGGRTTAEISDSLPSLFTPAGYVFSIWGLIYLALIGFVVFQALPAQQSNPFVRATGWWFAVTCLANVLWIFCWQYGYFLASLPLMATLLVSLIVLYRRLAAQGRPVGATRWLVQLPFSLYLGWITVATVANISAVLVGQGWSGWPLSAVIWTVVMVIVAAGLAVVMLARYWDVAYAAVLVWALAGILVKQAATPAIVAACGLAIAAIVVAAVATRSGRGRLAPEPAR